MKLKTTFENFGKYLSQVSVVVIGIAITFMLNDWIGSRNEQKNLQRHLAMVKMELEDNLETVQQQFEFYDETGKLAKYLYSCKKQENLREDSLTKHVDVIRDLRYMSYTTSAFEMLKSSGTMRLIKDKDLLRSILDCYRQMEYVKTVGDREMEVKKREVLNAFLENGISKNVLDLKAPEYKRLFYYFSAYTAAEGNFRTCKQQIEKTLEMF